MTFVMRGERLAEGLAHDIVASAPRLREPPRHHQKTR